MFSVYEMKIYVSPISLPPYSPVSTHLFTRISGDNEGLRLGSRNRDRHEFLENIKVFSYNFLLVIPYRGVYL